MSSQRYPEEFKTEAVKQILDHGHSVADVSSRLGVSTHSLYKWVRARSDIFNYIEMFYNPRRRHSSADGLPPAEFERRHFLRLQGV